MQYTFSVIYVGWTNFTLFVTLPFTQALNWLRLMPEDTALHIFISYKTSPRLICIKRSTSRFTVAELFKMPKDCLHHARFYLSFWIETMHGSSFAHCRLMFGSWWGLERFQSGQRNNSAWDFNTANTLFLILRTSNTPQTVWIFMKKHNKILNFGRYESPDHYHVLCILTDLYRVYEHGGMVQFLTWFSSFLHFRLSIFSYLRISMVVSFWMSVSQKEPVQ